MANIYVEAKGPKGVHAKESLLPAAVSGYTRGLCVNYGSDAYHATLVTQAATAPLGILEEDAINILNPCSVIEFGQVVAQIGASVTAQQQLTTDANGRLVPATSGQPVVAIALEPQTYVSPASFANVFFFGLMGPNAAAVASPTTYYTASGAIAVGIGTAVLNAATLLAMTLAAPTAAQDGTVLQIVAETAKAHTVTTPASGINGASTVLTFAAVGDSVTLQAMNQTWVVTAIRGSATVAASTTAYVANGAIGPTVGSATLGSGAAIAMTLVTPTVAQEDTTILIVAVTAHAHTVTTLANIINGVDDLSITHKFHPDHDAQLDVS
jgi:hypothetical protein